MYGNAFIIGSLNNTGRNAALRFIINGFSLEWAYWAISIIDSGLTVKKKL